MSSSHVFANSAKSVSQIREAGSQGSCSRANILLTRLKIGAHELLTSKKAPLMSRNGKSDDRHLHFPWFRARGKKGSRGRAAHS
jgi:hypothetical protein